MTVAKQCQRCQQEIPEGALGQGIVQPEIGTGTCREFWLCLSCFRAELREQHLRVAESGDDGQQSLEAVISAMWARITSWPALRQQPAPADSFPRHRSIATNPSLPALQAVGAGHAGRR